MISMTYVFINIVVLAVILGNQYIVLERLYDPDVELYTPLG
jgi:hypothetical protein